MADWQTFVPMRGMLSHDFRVNFLLTPSALENPISPANPEMRRGRTFVTLPSSLFHFDRNILDNESSPSSLYFPLCRTTDIGHPRLIILREIYKFTTLNRSLYLPPRSFFHPTILRPKSNNNETRFFNNKKVVK